MQRTYVKLTESGDVEQSTAINEKNLSAVERALAEGFLPLVSQECTIEESSLGELEELEWRYSQEEGRVVRHKESVTNKPTKIDSMIRELKDDLARGDYFVIKSVESLLAKGSCSEEFMLLHKDREALRRRIHELEDLLLTD